MPLPGKHYDRKPQNQSDRNTRLLVCLAFSALVLIIGASIVYNTLYPPLWTERLSLLNARDQPLTITDYRYSTDVSYNELVEFLANDTTNLANYSYPNYTCGDFAVHLHDNAEVHGIRSGIVGVSLNTTGYTGMDISYLIPAKTGTFNNSDNGHGFVVFNTTDRGPVYIDPTGVTSTEKAQGSQPHYMVVYFKQGMPLGEIWINQSESLDYAYYQQKESQYQAYDHNISQYNDEVSAYNSEIKTFNITMESYNSDHDSFVAEYDRYTAELNDLTDTNVSTQEMPAQLEIWRTGLVDWLGALNSKQAAIQSRSEYLDAEKLKLDEKRTAIQQSAEAKWVMTMPYGIVDTVVVYW